MSANAMTFWSLATKTFWSPSGLPQFWHPQPHSSSSFLHLCLFCLCLVKTQIPAKVPSVMRCRSWTATSSLKKIKKFSYKENVCLSATKQILFFFCNKQNSVCLQGLKSSSVILLGVEDHGDQITPMHKSDQKFSISCSLWHLGSRISTRTDG